MNYRMIFRRISLWIFLWIFASAHAQETFVTDKDGLPEVPSFQTSVYDYARILKPWQKKRLEQKLIAYSDTTSTQIVIATVPHLGTHDINLYAAEWAHKWGIGQKGKDNGIFILLAPNDRKVAIQNGYGVEDRLTDALSSRIIENIMIPHFRKGDYYGGLDKATDVIFAILQGKFDAETLKGSGDTDWLVILFIIFFIILVIIAIKKGSGGSGSGGYTIDNVGPVFWGGDLGGGSSGGGFGGFGGGGFSGGFGGGGFGGGGASGGW